MSFGFLITLNQHLATILAPSPAYYSDYVQLYIFPNFELKLLFLTLVAM